MNTLNGLKQWRCPRGHVLGIVERVRRTNGRGQSYHVSRLMLFRQAINVDYAAEVDVMAVVEGTALDIRCSVCGEVRAWYMGADALEGLMGGIGNRD